jgi:hypothetical protein
MARPKIPYVGDDAVRKLLDRYACPAPFHVVRLRFLGEIMSPAVKVSPTDTIMSLWNGELPVFDSTQDASAFFEGMFGLWNHMVRQHGTGRSVRLAKIGPFDTREGMRAAAATRVEELYQGFLRGLVGENEAIDLPAGVPGLLARIEKGIELLARARNTFAHPAGPDDAAILAELANVFPIVDRALQEDLNAVVVAMARWRRQQAMGRTRIH